MTAGKTVDDFDPIVTASDREALRRGYRFDREKADRPVRWIERFCKLSIGEDKGKPLILLDWQRRLLWRLFGWVDRQGRRRFREVFCEVPKKNGKSTFVSALALYLLTKDGENRPKIHVNATETSQAAIIWEECDQMIRASPALAKRLDSREFYKDVKFRENSGHLKTNSSEVDGKDGGNVSCVVFDELHRFTGRWGRDAWQVYAGAGARRAQPLKISISTAGYDRDSVMYEQHKRAWQVIQGEVVDDVTFLPVVFGPEPDEQVDPHDESTWRRFNPALGEGMSIEGFRADYESMRYSPESFNYWKRTRLNVWTQDARRFVDADRWAACGKVRRRTLDEIAASGDPWFVGYDLASVDDLCSWVEVAGNLEDGIDVWCHSWLPRETALAKQKSVGTPYLDWAEKGFITLIDEPRIDEAAILRYAVESHGRTKYQMAYGDWYHAVTFGAGLAAEGLPYKVARAGTVTLNAPTRWLDRLIAAGKVRHGDNPVLTWSASNAVVQRDSNDLIKISREQSHAKIDPMAGLVNAILGLIDRQVAESQEPKPVADGRIRWRSYGRCDPSPRSSEG